MLTQRYKLIALGLLFLILFISTPAELMAQETTLYDRLGGQVGIEAVVDEFLLNVAGDERINAYFSGVDLERLGRLLTEQICEATGGPCTYTGRNMGQAHAGLGITEADFNALVEDLVKALDTFVVPEQTQNQLLAILASLKEDIVAAPANEK